MPRYVMVSVSSGTPWQVDERVVEFAGQAIRLVPPRRDESGELRAYPLAAIEQPPGCSEEMLVRVIRRFLAALAWRDQAGIREVDVSYGAPLRTGTRIPDNGTTPAFESADLPDPADKRAQIALAFYAEGLSLLHTHIAYSFLSFFKILNVRYNHGPDQVAWINLQCDRGALSSCGERVAEIQSAHGDVGAYLYGSGRCAVAHAFSQPLVDPNAIADQQRLSRDLPVVRLLAGIMIHDELGVPKPRYNAAA